MRIMAGSWTSMLGNDAIVQMVGHEAFARGMVYARNGRVTDIELDEPGLIIRGRVRGSYHDDYATSIQLAQSASGVLTAHRGVCSCPVAMDCKHAAAVLIVARSMAGVSAQLAQPAWERALRKVAVAPDPPPVVSDVLGLEFEVEQMPTYRGQPSRIDLRIRPLRAGKSGKWIRTGIGWEDLDYASRSYLPTHVDLLLQFRAAAGASARYMFPRTPWLSVSSVTSVWWSLLEQAAESGLTLLVAGSTSGPQLCETKASVVLNVRRSDEGALIVSPAVLQEGHELQLPRIGLLGDPAHGLFHWEPGLNPTPTLSLLQLTQPLTRELRQLLAEGSSLTIPPADEHRFTTDYVPQLRQKVAITSTDGSVSLPECRPPVLTLLATFKEEHRLRLDWAWEYRIGDSVATFDLDEPVKRPSVRDVAEEQRQLERLPLPYDKIPLLAEVGGRPRPLAHVLLGGVHAALCAAEVLPALDKAGVQVTLLGDVLDYRETGAQPMIEVSTAENEEDSDWFDLHIAVSIENEVVPFEALFVALSQRQDYLILDTGVYFPLDRPELDQLRDLIEEARALQDRDRPGLRISKFQAGLWDELIKLGVVVGQAERWITSVRALSGKDQATASPKFVATPPTLKATLRPYQVEGFRWLQMLWSHGLGGILADDMGLGKTVQALALICHARLAMPDQPPFLVVAPTSVVSNWAAEADRFAPDLSMITIEGSQARRRHSLAEAVAGADVVVTSYTLLRIDADSYAELPWAGVLLDEAQFVKNYRAKTYQSARRLRSDFKLAITGTPLENNLMELWALLSIAAPGLFPHPDRFSEFYRRPIERGQDPHLMGRLRRRISPLMLRRTKERVASELPPKQEQVVEVVLQPKHMRIYQTHLQRERQKVLGLIDDLDRNRFTILRSLTLLRQLSLDPSLVDDIHAGVPASKIEVLCEQLRELVAEGHSGLVFSQFTGFLGKIRARLEEEGIDYAYLDGRTRNRSVAVERFRSGRVPVFLISLKAGGFGLNLPEADYCFLLDPWWNPATEAQAVDRTHRIGQTKTVLVYRLVARDTIEEKVMELKTRKEQLFAAMFGDDALAGVPLSVTEIRALVS
jgi:superfamily II DNA or RNA helicase